MNNETLVRLGSFLGIFIVMTIWELAAPRRRLTVAKAYRWGNNLGLILIDTLLVKLLFPMAAIGVATVAHQQGWGLLNYWQLPQLPAMIMSLLFLDLVVYLQHLLFHVAPTLWRLHMVHHADLDIDVTTGLRFHPVEIIISLVIKMAAVAAIGPPVLVVLIFEVTLNGTAMFNHSNVRLPTTLDTVLRLLVVTPDMHRVHHSVAIRETNTNFGFNFPWWDRLFGTYRAQPVAGHTAMTIGLSQYREPRQVSLDRLLLLPIIGDPGRYSLKHIGGEPRAPRQQKKNYPKGGKS
ncbi:MAG: sterol desaturase family protein [Proteobacteria bacterium]|nr:sterol desaturase family protein [Pseudomonadota bacterium]MBU1687236.1 sterol desaturase family protein [Pseudomonadota bacterium]